MLCNVNGNAWCNTYKKQVTFILIVSITETKISKNLSALEVDEFVTYIRSYCKYLFIHICSSILNTIHQIAIAFMITYNYTYCPIRVNVITNFRLNFECCLAIYASILSTCETNCSTYIPLCICTNCQSDSN